MSCWIMFLNWWSMVIFFNSYDNILDLKRTLNQEAFLRAGGPFCCKYFGDWRIKRGAYSLPGSKVEIS